MHEIWEKNREHWKFKALRSNVKPLSIYLDASVSSIFQREKTRGRESLKRNKTIMLFIKKTKAMVRMN